MSRPIAVDTSLTPMDGAYIERIVTKKSAGSPCPSSNPGWSVRPLFATGSGAPLPPELSRYCLYTWNLSSPVSLPAFSQAGLEGTADHMVVTPASAPTLTEITQAGYRDEYLHAVGRPPVHTSVSAVKPRIAILDTSPDSSAAVSGWETLGINDHGYALANMVQNLQTVEVDHGVTSTFESVAEVTTRLTMDMYVDASGQVLQDSVGGGDFGTIAVLAESIYAEVEAWKLDGAAQPLIINLSLGWDPLFGGTDPSSSDWSYDIQAVYDALYEAACQGAVVLASSGNRSGGPDGDVGAIYPAAWGVDTIDDSDCATRSGGAASDYSTVHGAPLLYAVGGVDEDGEDLAVSRLDSRPPLVAFGDHAVDLDHTGAYTSILTGTSVSAAVAAASLAVAWSNVPNAAGHHVMNAVYESGLPVGVTEGDFCTTSPCEEARQIDVCNVVSRVCHSPSLGICAGVSLPVTCTSGPDVDGSPDPADLAAFEAATPSFTLEFPYAPRTASECDGGAIELYAETPWRADDPCPEQQFYDAAMEPWTNPQPKHDTCPPCYIDTGTGVAYLEMKELSTFDSLSIYASFSGSVSSYSTKDIPSGDSVVYTFDPSYLSGAEKAWVTGTASGKSYSAAIELR